MALPTVLASTLWSVKINGMNLDTLGFHVDSVSGLEMPPIRVEEDVFAGLHGSKVWGDFFATRPIRLTGYVFGDTNSDLISRIDTLKSYFATFSGVSPWKGNAPLLLERVDQSRYYECYYDGVFECAPQGSWRVATSATLTVGLRCANPFAFASGISITNITGGVGWYRIPSRTVTDGPTIGNARVLPRYNLLAGGSVINPIVYIGDIAFIAHFDWDLKYSNYTNPVTLLTGTHSGSPIYSYKKYKGGIYINTGAGETLSFASVNVPSFEYSVLVLLQPTWAYTNGSTITIFQHYYGANDYYLLNWGGATKWQFIKKSKPTADPVKTVTLESMVQSFAANDPVYIMLTFSTTNGMKIYINGLLNASDASTSGWNEALAGQPNTLYMHLSGSTMNAATYVDEMYCWSRELNAEEVMKYTTNPMLIKNFNQKMGWVGTTAINDVIIFDADKYTIDYYTKVTGVLSNGISGLTGMIPSIMPPATMMSVETANTSIYVQFRKSYL